VQSWLRIFSTARRRVHECVCCSRVSADARPVRQYGRAGETTGEDFSLNPMNFRRATSHDCALLAELNRQLIRDEGHRNKMTVPELEQRMKDWLASEYAAVIFEIGGEIVAYALYRERAEEIYLRQLFVTRNQRQQGIGRKAIEILRSKIWPKNKRLTVEVLVSNASGVAFWRAVGYKDYSLSLEVLPG
jgi:predicted acetyltransferase